MMGQPDTSHSPVPLHHREWPRIAAFLGCILAATLAGPRLPAAEPLHEWDVIAHFQLPDGTERTMHVEDFHFVYYERHYVHVNVKAGSPPKLKVRDVPIEVMSIQNEKLQRLRFSRISRIQLEYRPVSGAQHLCLVATPLPPEEASIVWPVSTLRNVSIGRIPHFRGRIDGKVVDFALPLREENGTDTGQVLTSIDFRFPGQAKHRTWL
jgi:hypothetical protein